MLVLFTDFGGHDPYVGQVKAVLAQHAPNVPVIDLLHDAPPFNIKAGAHLLAAFCSRFAPGSVFLAVVDPGVGGERNAAVMEADGRFFVGPDNGLLSVVAARAVQRRFWRMSWKPADLSDSFHGRDLFAPIAAWIARGTFPTPKLAPVSALDVDLGGDDLGEIIYIDHYGNAMTGLQATLLARDARLVVAHRHVGFARMFSDVPKGTPFWYENSVGLVEIAVNCGSAGECLGLEVGQHVMAVMSG
jgi:S-adenosyl-L-methionine hydrolase (adenosine-forming)